MESLEKQLLNAVQEENSTEVLHLIEKGANCNNYPKGRTPLSIAAKLGNVEIIDILLNKIPSASLLRQKSVEGNNAYYVFVHQGKDEVIDDITPEGMESLEWDVEVDVERESEEEDTDIWANQYRWYADILERTCPLNDPVTPTPVRGADINLRDSSGRVALHFAAEAGHSHVVDLLLHHSYTALCEAVWQKSVAAAHALVAAGARVKPTNYLVHYATVHRHEEMVRLLVEAGALLNIRDSMGQTPLIAAALTDQPHLIDYLIEKGAAVDFYWDQTPLSAYVASRHGRRLEVVDTLLRHGADAVRANHHDAPLATAIVGGKFAIAAQLVASGSVSPEVEFSHPSYCGADAMRLIVQLIDSHYSVAALLQLADTLILAGYSISKLNEMQRTCSKKCHPLVDLFNFRKSNPLSLADKCRIIVRSEMTQPLVAWIPKVCLPPALASYLLMKDRISAVMDPPPI